MCVSHLSVPFDSVLCAILKNGNVLIVASRLGIKELGVLKHTLNVFLSKPVILVNVTHSITYS